MTVQEQVEKWKRENVEVAKDNPELSESEQELDRFISCVPYHTTCRIRDCINRTDGKTIYNRKIEKNKVKGVSPKPKFVNCVSCNVFTLMADPKILQRPGETHNE